MKINNLKSINKKAGVSISIVFLVLGSLIVFSFALFIFNSGLNKIEVNFIDVDSFNELRTQEVVISYYLENIFDKSVERILINPNVNNINFKEFLFKEIIKEIDSYGEFNSNVAINQIFGQKDSLKIQDINVFENPNEDGKIIEWNVDFYLENSVKRDSKTMIYIKRNFREQFQYFLF